MKKVDWISNTRVFATLGIILLHIAAILVVREPLSTTNWWIGNVFDSMVRCSTALFFMITGALFLSKDIEILSFLKKRFLRIVIPFLFWSFIYFVNETIFDSTRNDSNFFINIWNSNYWGKLFHNDIALHFWYVLSVLGLYLFIPILNRWIKNSTVKEILYFLSIWFITLVINYSFFKERISNDLRPVYFSGYVGYLVLGYFLYKFDLRELLGKRVAKLDNKYFYFSIFLLAWLITIFGAYFISLKRGGFSDVYYGRLSINVMFAAVGIFLFMKSWNPKSKIFVKTINFTFKYCYGIYLVHILVLSYLNKYGITGYFIHPAIGIPITTITCFGISLLLIFLVNKLPFIGKYISG